MSKEEISRQLAEHLAKLGAKGGKAAARKLSPKQRSERARKAVEARERKRKQKGKTL
ncbi:MAG: hypothetical protein LAO03_12400 [Acidobacteriia bacterium]|nr:hypothetical protein [Terriglobia bacterium]